MQDYHSLMVGLKNWINRLEHFVSRPWYPIMVAVLAGLDLFILIIPTDGLLITAGLAMPRRWWFIAGVVALGSTLGCVALSGILYSNPEFLDHILNKYANSTSWMKTAEFGTRYGLVAIFLGCASPLALQPFVLLGPVLKIPILRFIIVVFVGRLLKFLFVTWICSHAPHLLKRIWGLKKDLKEVGLLEKTSTQIRPK